MYIMRAIITPIVFIGYICVISMTIPAKKQSMRPASIIAYNYKPSLHRVLWKSCDLYFVNGTYFGEIAPDTNIGVSGNHYFNSNEKRVHRLGIFDTDIRIVGAHTIFISDDKQIGNARITNYDGTVTIYNDKRSIELETKETLLIDKDGRFEKFTNEFASSDSLWLTAGEIWLNNIDMVTLINRLAINFGCKVQYNYLPGDERIINAQNVYFDCKSVSLYDGLQILQSIATGSQNFSYHIKNGIIYIDKCGD